MGPGPGPGTGRAAPQGEGEGTVRAEFQPLGLRVAVAPGETVLDAARAGGVQLVSVCGGYGLCGTCRVVAGTGGLGRPTDLELEELGAAQLSAGVRLACQAVVTGDVSIEVPPESLSAPQRLQFEDRLLSHVAVDPSVVALDVEVAPPVIDDLRSDDSRLRDAVAAAGEPVTDASLSVLAAAPLTLRSQGWAARAVVRRGRGGARLVTLLPAGAAPLGAAVDIGTTKLAAYIVDLSSGETKAKGATANPQFSMGEDVMSRITYAGTHEGGAQELHVRLVEGINKLLADLRAQLGAPLGQLVDAVAVGNTAMHHSFVNLPLDQLGTAPYVPAVSEALELRAADVGLEMAPGAHVYLPPNIAGFVGADHTSAVLASGAARSGRTVLVVDIGTNTEISLAFGGELWTCSCASGPAFEGAHIRDGMRAAGGAIERVAFVDGSFQVQTIGEGPATGICGSGILDAVAAALRAGVLSRRGGFRRDHRLVSGPAAAPMCILVPASLTAHGRDIALTRHDVSEIQLAKAAIRAGIELLVAAAGARTEAVDEVVIAGAFGTYLDLGSAIAVGMLPDLPHARFRQVGNAAGQGAQQLLVSVRSRQEAAEIAHRAQYIELTTYPGFADAFADELSFGQNSEGAVPPVAPATRHGDGEHGKEQSEKVQMNTTKGAKP